MSDTIAPTPQPWGPQAEAAADDLRVICAGGFFAAMKRIGPAFEAASGVRLALTYGAPARTRELMLGETGADVGVVVAATLKDVEAAGRLAPDSRFRVALSPIGLGVPSGRPHPDLSSLEAFRATILSASAIGLSDPKAGTNLANEVLAAAERQGFGAEMRARVRFVEGPGSVVSAEVAKGGFDFVITLASEIVPIDGVDYVGALPVAMQTEYGMDAAMMARAHHHASAQAFLTFLKTEAARGAMRDVGLVPA